jgi:hypothetical protein
VAGRAKALDHRPEDQHVRGRGHVDPDLHGVTRVAGSRGRVAGSQVGAMPAQPLLRRSRVGARG